MAVPLKLRAKAQLELIRRREREKLSSRYDWYGDECECGVPLGSCHEHKRARPSQRPPGSYRASDPRDGWRIWLLKAGRGFGKSITAAKFVHDQVEKGGVRWVALVGATAADVRDYQIEHPKSGLVAIAPPWFRPIYEPSKRRVTWPNGAFATIFTSEEPEGLRGGGFNLAWVDELAKWGRNQQYTWDMLEFALRELTDPRPRVVVSTTPRPTPTYYQVRDDPRTVVTGGPMSENAPNLDSDYIRSITDKYAGTRMGRQELDAEDEIEVAGALWTIDMISANRRQAVPMGVDLVKVAVGVDPGAGSQDPESAAETGIVVAARGSDGRGYVLEDATTKGSPDTWATAAVEVYRSRMADVLAAEINNGGDMVVSTINAVDPGIVVKKLWASRGKLTRAEPIARLYEQGRIHHVGIFPALEAQLTNWVPGDKSPDRLDALCWALTEVMLEGTASGRIAIGGRRPVYS